MSHFPTASRPPNSIALQHYQNAIPNKIDESQILLAIQTTHSPCKLSIRETARVYNVPRITLGRRIRGVDPALGRRDKSRPLTKSEEEVFVQYVLNLDSRRFSPRIDDVRDMANRLHATRSAKPVGHNWPYRFVHNEPELKTRLSRAYDI